MIEPQQGGGREAAWQLPQRHETQQEIIPTTEKSGSWSWSWELGVCGVASANIEMGEPPKIARNVCRDKEI